jgi:hypothetical protein
MLNTNRNGLPHRVVGSHSANLHVDRGNENLAILPKDRLLGVAAKLREWEHERDGLRRELHGIATESPSLQLKQ